MTDQVADLKDDRLKHVEDAGQVVVEKDKLLKVWRAQYAFK